MTIFPNRINEWRQKKGLTLQALAEASGTTKSQIDKLEKGARRLTVEWMVRLSRPLNCAPQDLLPLSAGCSPLEEGQQHPFPPLPASPSIPVFSLIKSKNAAEKQLSPQPTDRTECPPFLAHVPNAMAIYMPDETMVPMYKPGQLLYLNPYKPPKAGNGVLVITTTGHAYIREYQKETAKGVLLRAHAPTPKDNALATDEIKSLSVIVGIKEPQ